MSENYTVTREEAAHQLDVSTRTLDRWLKSGKLKSKMISRNIFVHANQLAKLLRVQAQKKLRVRKSDRAEDIAIPSSQSFVTDQYSEEKVFRQLYEEVNTDLKAKQEKLEAASFRVGQLENQLKNSVPLLEYKQKEDELRQEAEAVKKNLDSLRLKNNLLLAGVIGLIAVTIVLAILFFR